MNLLRSVWRSHWLGLFRCHFGWFHGRGWRSRLHNPRSGCQRCRTEILFDLGVERFAGICLQRLLFSCECYWRWRRRNLGHYRTADYRVRGFRRSAHSRGARNTRAACPHHTCFHGNHWSDVKHRSGRARSDSHRCLCHGQRVHESCSGHCRNGTRHSLVDICRGLNVVVHYICNRRLPHNSICHVYVGDVRRACLVRWHVDFSRSQREPRYSAPVSGISR